MAALHTQREMTTDFVKLERFDGGNFIRCQRRIHFLLVSLQVAYVLNTPKPEEMENETIVETRKRHKFEHDDEICRGHMLNAMSDALFDIYQDNRPVMEQLNEIERTLNHFKMHEMHIDETIIVSSIIDKLPPTWRDFRRSLKHKKDDISLDDLAKSLRVEEEFHLQDEPKEPSVPRFQNHMVEETSK
ncbi:uncharacterized protein LOC116134755 [Pistacia vera]|uniref:uncharacterized protein LOC116134755 n=1 Tax=Pistacia vera TaxID=55513 RepID=UPI0012635E37|nr:uncharacterized protein LOC116134755 [Pistacia vera]